GCGGGYRVPPCLLDRLGPAAGRGPRRWWRWAVVENNRAAANTVIAPRLEIVEQQRRCLGYGVADPWLAKAVAVDFPITIATAIKLAAKPVAPHALGQLFDPSPIAGTRLGRQGRERQPGKQPGDCRPQHAHLPVLPLDGGPTARGFELPAR